MKNLVEINKAAITVLSFMTSPAGLLCVIAISLSIETLGIAMFFSGLFIGKTKEYVEAAGFVSQTSISSSAVVSLVVGGVLSTTISLGILVLKLIGKESLSRFISFAFALLSIVTYWQALGNGIEFSIMKLLGVCLMVSVPSLIGLVCSSHLAKLILHSDTFKAMQNNIFKKATGGQSNTFAQQQKDFQTFSVN